MINRLKIIVQNKDAKGLIENFFSLSLLSVISYAFPLITLPYLSRVIGVEAFGDIAFAASIIVYFETLTTFGFNYTAVRDIAKNRDNKEIVSSIFYNVMYAKVVLMLLSLLILTTLVFTVPLLYDKRELIFYTFLLVPGHILFPDWFFQAIEKMKFITIINFFSKLLFTVLVFLVIREKSDYIYQPILTAIGYLLAGIISYFVAKKEYSLSFSYPSFTGILATIKSSYNMFITLFLPNLYSTFSTTLLGFYGTSFTTGVYSSGSRLIFLSSQITNTFSQTFYPFLSRKNNKHYLYARISGIVSLLMGLFLFFSADFLVDFFYTLEFSDAAIVMKIMSPYPIFSFLAIVYGKDLFAIHQREYITRNIMIIVSIVGFILLWFAVLWYGYIGVALAVTFTAGLRGVLMLYYAKKIVGLK